MERNRRIPLALIVALMALMALIAVVATTASALPGKGSVDKNDLQKNTVKAKSIKANAVTEAKIKDAAVATAKVADAAITAAKLADGSVTTPKIAADAVNSAKVAADSLTAADLAPGVLKVVAFGQISNPDPGAPTIVNGDVGLLDVIAGPADSGRTDVLIEPSVLPAGSLSACSVQATPTDDSVANVGTSLGFDTVTVATGSPAPANLVQVQTRGAGEVLNDFDYFIQVTCAGV